MHEVTLLMAPYCPNTRLRSSSLGLLMLWSDTPPPPPPPPKVILMLRSCKVPVSLSRPLGGET